MKKFQETFKKLKRMDSTRPLMENNKDLQGGHEFERHRGPNMSINGQSSRELLPLCSGEASDDEHDSSDRSEPNSVQSNDHSTQTSEPLTFPDPPADLDRHLDQHLKTIEEIVENELKKLSHSMSEEDRTRLKKHFHCETCTHLNNLLQNISTSKNCSLLMTWVLQRKNLLDNPDLELLDDWETKTQTKLLKRVQEEVSDSLEKILKVDQSQTCHNDETYVQLYVDLIQCIDAMPKLAQSATLFYRVQEVCFQELLNFVKRYTSEQAEILDKKTQTWREMMDKPEMIHFLKTLRTCKELRQHIQTNGNAIKPVLLKEIKGTLENMEAKTLQLLKKVVTELAETSLKDYFKLTSGVCAFFPLHKSCKRECDLFAALKTYFPKLSYASDEQRIVMDEVYKVVAHSYLKHLIQQSKRKLKKHWSPDVGQAVWDDADQLHTTISDLAPGVQQWNGMLQKIQEVLDCKSIDTLKLIIAGIQKDFEKQSEDLKLLPNLVQWKGLSKREVREVLEALPDSPPMPSSGSLFSCCCG
ncbi:uncharacterized protein LOC124855758 [Girardinichthys multiradiatus]|uniref:uncharacterized protein LOC124855758 n=1 Tax=Girardinichthys multiradiatus TaxID=208333 RepID=UPI001FAC8AC2|nr:uncharacterized protein LOC124855758 [Girardinichthys multiradiatus]